MTFDKDVLSNRILSIVDYKLISTVERKSQAARAAAIRVQSGLFPTMARLIIGVTEPPNLDGYGADWYELNPNYTAKRKRSTNGRVSEGQFYKFSGGLSRSLNQSSAVNSFGLPAVRILQSGTYRRSPVTISGSSARINKTGRFIDINKVSNLKYAIEVDLYPKIKNLTTRKLELDNYVSSKIAYKLTNYRGAEDRPIFKQFLIWWLRVIATKAIRKAMK